ncbi:TonB-dependent receptor [Methylobacillus arboreus]|uniref:TonB-dependent receptor n=1 Tax=Methylobacillus arboreus TaxID=755170 RepID=UPI001E627AF7|nr:TonB-dependent receptor [Methylobacillus arboreus]MCB5190108.1 TonB-dependent receptor [Methylobacillus arboreus]
MPRRQHHHRNIPIPKTMALRQSAACGASMLLSTTMYLAMPGIAHADTPAATRPAEAAQYYNISAGPLAAALRSLASNANVLLTFTEAQTAGKTTTGLAGQYTLQGALAALLAGTGLQAAQVSGGGYVLRNASVVSDAVLPEISVRERAELPGELPRAYAGGQVARGGRVGMLGNRDVMDTPFNIASYTSDLIRNQQAATLADVLDNDSAVRMSSRGRNTSIGGGDNFFMRGFVLGNRDVALNGLYGVLPYGTLSLETVERVEVLKGPGALLMGMAPSGGVGGAINVVPKRATDQPITRFTLNYASDSQWGGHIDLGRRWGEQNQFGIRLNGVYRSGDTAISNQEATLITGAIGLDFRGEKLRASLDIGYQSDDVKGASLGYRLSPSLQYIPGTPRVGKQLAQDWERRKYRDDYQVAQAEYDISSAWTVYGAAGTRDHEHSNFRTESRIEAADGLLRVSPVNYPEYSDTKSYLLGSRVKFMALAAQHEVNVSYSVMDIEAGYGFAQWAAFASSLENPVWVADPVASNAPYGGFFGMRKASETKISSVGVSDTMSWHDGALQLILGLRRQKVAIDNYDGGSPVNSKASEYDKTVNTPALGIVVKPWDNTSLYVNYIEGLSPGAQVTPPAENAGQVFEPVKTKQKEIGVKVDFGRLLGTIALFELKQPNAINVPGSTPTAYLYRMDGEQRNRGIELSVAGELADGLRTISGVTYMQANQMRTQDGNNDGRDAVAAPRWIANAGLEWDAPFAPGLTLSTRAIATGEQYVNAQNTLSLPGWVRWDLGARYRTDYLGHPLTLRANIQNVANRSFWESSAGSGGIVLSAPRVLTVSATIDF